MGCFALPWSMVVPRMSSAWGRALAVAAGVALGSCDRPEPRVHEIAKGIEAIEPASEERALRSPAAVAAGGMEASPGIEWDAPAAWRPRAGAGAMREATYLAPAPGGEVEVVVSQFPGDVGGLLANVNRWRGQVGLPPVDTEELEGVVQAFEAPGLVGHWMRLRGSDQEMLAAVIAEPGADRTWFVKAVAGPEQAAALEGEVAAFARSFRVAAGVGEGGDGGS